MKLALHQIRSLVLVALVVSALAALPAAARTHAGLVTITSGPPPRTLATSATFAFSINANFANTQFFCELDGKPSGACTSPKTYTGLAVGEHTFKVSAYAGEIGLGSDSRTWLVDSTTPDFALKLNPAELPLTTRPGFTSANPVKIQVIRLGGSKGPLQIQNATTSGSAQILTIAPGLRATVVPDDATNPLTLTVSLSATASAKTEIGKSFTLTARPASAAVGPVARSVSIPYAVVDEYDLVVRGLDVTQGIQPDQALPPGRTAAYGGVKLVKNKRTSVRVYAAVAAPPAKQVSGAAIFLYGWTFKDGFPQQSLGAPLIKHATLSPGPDAPVSLSMLQTAKPSAVFTLPPEWTQKGPIALTAKVLPPSLYQPPESECTSVSCTANNGYKLVDIPFIDTGFVQLWAVYLKLRGGLSPCCPETQNPGYLADTPLDAAERLLPLADGALRTGGDFRAEYDATNRVRRAMQQFAIWGWGCCSLNDALIDYSEDLPYHQVCPGTSNCPDVVMSMIDDTPVPGPWYVNGVSKGAMSTSPLVYAPAHTLVNVRRPLTSVAHELGHALGLPHASWGCGGGAGDQKGDPFWPDPFGYIHGVGFDRRDETPIYDGTGNGPAKQSTASASLPGSATTVWSAPGSWYDFMSYCAGTDEWLLHAPTDPRTPQQGDISPWQRTDAWISTSNWKRVQDFLALLKTSHRAHGQTDALRALAPDEATLAVRAFVANGHVGVTRVRPRAGQPSAGTTSGYEVVLRTAQGSELARWPLTVTSSEGHGAASTFLSADVPLAGVEPGKLPARLAALEVVGGETVLARVTRSASAPNVRLLSPTAGERVGTDDTTAVTWTASDADADAALEVAIDYAATDGNDWTTIYQGPNTGRADLPSRLLGASGQARLRIRVSDGFDETPATSSRFVAAGRPPTVRILSPTPGERAAVDALVYLSATAYDDTGTFLDGDRIAWYDGRRLVSRDRITSVTGLAPGLHILRAEARDEKGRVASAKVRVGILPAAPTIIVSRAPAAVSPAARSVELELACTIASTLTISGPAGGLFRTECGVHARRVVVPIRPGRARVRLVLRAQAYGRASEKTLVFPVPAARSLP